MKYPKRIKYRGRVEERYAAEARPCLNVDCADMSALWNDATCRVEESGVKPPQSKVRRTLIANPYQELPGAPTLYITGSGNTVTVFWQDVSGWSLQQNNNLTVPAGWTGSSGVTTSNGTNYLNITPPTGNLFFRLANP